MKKIIKKNFTLLEIIITFTLVIFCFSFLGMKVNTALYSYKYKSNIKKIDNCFEFCKKMAQTNQSDIYLKLSQRNEKIFYEIGTNESIGFFKNSRKIKDKFEDIYFSFEGKKVNDIEIVFSTTGEIFPNGALEFSDKKNKFKDKKVLNKQIKCL